jgi:hypothetical protein
MPFGLGDGKVKVDQLLLPQKIASLQSHGYRNSHNDQSQVSLAKPLYLLNKDNNSEN